MVPQLLLRAHRSTAYRLVAGYRPQSVRSRIHRPIASFTFDDSPASSFDVGAALLEEHDVRGTFYLAGGFANTHERGIPHFNLDQLRRALQAGHELGCHTFDHIDLATSPPKALDESCDRNRTFFEAALGAWDPASFAYPFGRVSISVKRRAVRRFGLCRGVDPGVNAGIVDVAQLRANPLDVRYASVTDVERLVEAACARPGWLIFFTHDVSNDPTSEGCTPDRLARALDSVLSAGMTVLPVAEAARTMRTGT